jgi:hypothetical protein
MSNKIRGLSTLLAALTAVLIALPASAQNFLTDIPEQSLGMVSGPEVGERIPDFEAYDQHGNLVSLADVMGPNGAVVVFYRSADW